MAKPHQTLLEKITDHSAVMGILGLGYVGLPLALRVGQAGFRCIGFDIDEKKIEQLNRSESYINHISTQKIQELRDTGFRATSDMTAATECDALIICVPTPLNKYREPDLSFVTNTVDAIVPHLRAGQILSLESTTYPGTTDEELQPRIESRGLKTGQDIFLVYSPEREDPGNPDFETRTIPKVVGGVTDQCLSLGAALYEKLIDQVVTVSSTRAAEMTKLLENIHRAVNIGLVNEMKIVADQMDIDIHEVIDAAATKPFGFTPYYPGPGLGGHCIPIDPFYLTWKAREYDLHTRFIELAGEVNTSMPHFVVDKVTQALNRNRKPLQDSELLLLGVAYKKNIGDMRESSSMKIMELLEAKGAKVSYSDPYVPELPKMRKYNLRKTSIALNPIMLQRFDAVILSTNHDDFNYVMIEENAQLIIDSRGVYRHQSPKIVKA